MISLRVGKDLPRSQDPSLSILPQIYRISHHQTLIHFHFWATSIFSSLFKTRLHYYFQKIVLFPPFNDYLSSGR